MAQIEIKRDNGNFQERLLSFVENKKGCDVVVVFGQERIPSHSIVLAANSGYFEKYLLNMPKVPKQFVLKGVDERITKQIIQYCSTGTIKIVENDVIKFLKHAHFLKIQTLIDTCITILNKMLNLTNCYELWKLAFQINLADLMGVTMKYMKTIEESYRDISRSSVSQLSKTAPIKHQKSLIVVGGNLNEKSNFVERYDAENNIWIEKEIKLNRSKFCSIFSGDKILIIGGEIANIPVKKVESLNPKNWTLTSLPPMKHARWMFSGVKFGISVFVFGGKGQDNDALSSVERFNTKTGKWWPIYPMPTERFNNRSVVINDDIYVVGGWKNGISLNVNECYSTSKKIWKSCAPMLENRQCPGVVANNGLIYVVGGHTKVKNNKNIWHDKHLSTIERYDPKVDKWTYIQSIAEPCHSMATEIFENKLVISGGYNGRDLQTVRQYDFEEEQWTPLPPLNIARCFHNMFLVPSEFVRFKKK